MQSVAQIRSYRRHPDHAESCCTSGPEGEPPGTAGRVPALLRSVFGL